MRAPHPIHDPDADKCCRWLAMSAGRRTGRDHREIAAALELLPFPDGPQLAPAETLIDPSQIWRLA